MPFLSRSSLIPQSISTISLSTFSISCKVNSAILHVVEKSCHKMGMVILFSSQVWLRRYKKCLRNARKNMKCLGIQIIAIYQNLPKTCNSYHLQLVVSLPHFSSFPHPITAPTIQCKWHVTGKRQLSRKQCFSYVSFKQQVQNFLHEIALRREI